MSTYSSAVFAELNLMIFIFIFLFHTVAKAQNSCEGISNSSDAIYDQDWVDGQNDGSGFGPWQLSGSGNYDHFMSISINNGNGDTNGDGDIDNGANSWGMKSNHPGMADAIRSFASPMIPGSTFSFHFDNGHVVSGNGGEVGFSLQNDQGEDLFRFFLLGTIDLYQFQDLNGIVPTGLIETDEGMVVDMTLTDSASLTVELTMLFTGITHVYYLNLMDPLGSRQPSKFRIYSLGSGPGNSHELFFNSLFLEHSSQAACCPDDIIADSDSGFCGAFVSFELPWEAGSGITECNGVEFDSNTIAIQTEGLISGSLFPIGNTINSYTITDNSGNQLCCSFSITVNNVNPVVVNGVVSGAHGLNPDGSINLNVSGGLPPYTFTWSNGSISKDLTGLASGIYSVLVEDATSCFAEDTFNIESLPLVFVEFDLHAFPFGLFNSASTDTSNRLRTSLNDQGIFPLSHLFGTAPWNYSGTESFPDYGSLPPNISDWVLVRLRLGINPSVVIEQGAFLIKSDGHLVRHDGFAPNFLLSSELTYFIELQHLNHLPIYTSNPVSIPISGGTISYDFTTSMEQAYRNPILNDDPMVGMQSASGVFYGMVAGNVQNLDGAVEANDINLFFSRYNESGIVGQWDVNIDGLTDSNDLNMIFLNYLINVHKPY